MPATFQIHPDHALVLVHYWGLATVEESYEAFGTYLMHPDYHPAQRHLVDLSGVTGVEQNFIRLFELQAGKAAAFMAGPAPVMLVYHAPCDLSLRVARLIQRSWEGLDGALVRVAIDWDGAADILGLRRAVLASLVSPTA